LGIEVRVEALEKRIQVAVKEEDLVNRIAVQKPLVS
jgi:hypothetical protein